MRVSLRSGLSHHSFPRGIRAKLELGLLALTCGYPISAQAQPPEQDSPASPLAQGDTQEDTGATASPPPQSAERITLPEPLNTPVAPVPGTEERVEIVLDLEVDARGHVASARARGGRQPYASRAEEATSAWLFRPATKGGKPLPAKIAVLVAFEPPPAAVPSPPESETEPAGAPRHPPQARASATPIQEVLILGELTDPGSRGFSRYETRKLAGAFDDPLRTVEVLPGVIPIITGLPVFFVRGAPPGNVGYFLDGIRIPQLFHGFLGPSVVHPAFLSKINLHAGPMPARFGRYAGAAVSADLAEPRGERRAEASVRLFDAGAFAESPFADGRGYAMLGGRYSYTGLILSLASDNQRLDYWDYQALAGYRLGRRDELSVFAFGSYDYAGSGDGLQAGAEFHRADLRYDHDFSDRASLRLALSGGSDRSRSQQGFLRNDVFAARAQFTYSGEDVAARAGMDLNVDSYAMAVNPAINEPEVYEDLFPPRTDILGGAYLDFVLFRRGPVRVIPGIRADVYSSGGATAVGVDPRMTAEYDITPKLRATHSLGVAHQAPSFVPNVPGAQVAGLRGGLQENLQAATTYELTLPWKLSLSLGGYLNVTEDLSDPIGTSQTLSVDETTPDLRVLGRSFGIEVFLERPLTRRIGGVFSYTFSQTLRSTELISTISGYDRPHVMNLALNFDLGSHWQAAAKTVVASGVPGRRTTLDGFVFDGSRSAPLIRVDLKISKRWYPSEHFNWGAHLEVLNATYAGSVSRRACGIRGCEDTGTAPIVIPSIGVDAAWN